MKKLIILTLLSITNVSIASELTAQIEANWRTERNWTNNEAIQAWIPSSKWSPELEATLSLQKGGFGLSLDISEQATTLGDLYYDFSTTHADWTLGRKPQEWAFAYSDSALNWLDDQPMLMREQYASFGQWQAVCLQEGSQSECINRLNGYLSTFDWQIMMGFNEHWRVAAGLQSQVGQGGLVYGEVYWAEQEASQKIVSLTSELSTLTNDVSNFSQINLGAQWSTASNLTLHWEVLLLNQGLDEQDWQHITAQLNTSAAGLIADSHEGPFGRIQHLLRASQSLGDYAIENVWIIWPQAHDSWLNEFSVSYDIDSRFSAKVEWQHAQKDSALSQIGLENKVAITFTFEDGF